MSPGPSLAVVLATTLEGGRGRGFLTAWAHGGGVALYGLLTVTGLAVVITDSPALFLTLQLGGAAYLMYLGIRSFRSQSKDQREEHEKGTQSNAALNGFLIAFLNPKLAVFMLALFSQFLRPSFGLAEKSVMVITVGLIDALWYSLMVTLSGHPTTLGWLRRHSEAIGRLFGLVLIALAATVMVKAINSIT